jgi:Mlc titration factor MtfA (ptsG expression regulator)
MYTGGLIGLALAGFEKLRQIKAVHSELYDALQAYYKVNPLEWFGPQHD